MHWKVRRLVWEDTMFKLNQTKADLHKANKVQLFTGELLVDQSGPSHEVFSLLNAAAIQKILSHEVFRHDVSLLKQK